MNFSNTLNYKIADLSVVHRTELENILVNVGIHSGQVFILFELWKKDGLSQIELAQNLRLSAPTINKMVKNLKLSGFVYLKRSDIDARLVRVFLTDRGKQVKTEVEVIWKDLETNITKHLTETEKLIFFQLLDKILLYFYSDSSTD